MTDSPDSQLDALGDVLGPSLRGGVTADGGEFVYALKNELDIAGADPFVLRLAELIDEGGAGQMVLELVQLEGVFDIEP